MPLLNNDYRPLYSIQFYPSLTGLSVRFVCPMIINIIPLHLSRDKSLCPLDLNLNDCVITLSLNVVNTLPFLTSSCGTSLAEKAFDINFILPVCIKENKKEGEPGFD